MMFEMHASMLFRIGVSTFIERFVVELEDCPKLPWVTICVPRLAVAEVAAQEMVIVCDVRIDMKC